MLVKKITLLGHKDHGKSTLIGNMLILTNRINPAKLKEAEKASKEAGTRFEPGYILDSFQEERLQGRTIDTTRTEKVPYGELAFEFIDVPGHEELIKNMISGASQADIAVLIISAKPGEGISDQTMRHLFVARMLGIRKLAVAVNKMDLVGYKREKFEEIKSEIIGFIERIGFSGKDVYFVPVSAYMKDNLIKKSDKMKWYEGKPLIDLIYANAVSKDAAVAGRELRVTLQGFVDSENKVMAGKIVSGSVKIGDRVRVWPQGFGSRVSDIMAKGVSVKAANTGTSVALRLKDSIKSEVRGSVISGETSSPRLSDTIKALIFVTHPPRKSGMKIKFNDIDIACKSLKVQKCIDTRTGEPKGNGRVEALDTIEAEMELDRKLPFESYDKTQELGRFVLYNDKGFAGIGIVE